MVNTFKVLYKHLLFTITSIISTFLVGQSQGFVLLKSNPSGAEVFINGKMTSKNTPISDATGCRNVSASCLSIQCTGNYEGDITVIYGQTTTKEINLKTSIWFNKYYFRTFRCFYTS